MLGFGDQGGTDTKEFLVMEDGEGHAETWVENAVTVQMSPETGREAIGGVKLSPNSCVPTGASTSTRVSMVPRPPYCWPWLVSQHRHSTAAAQCRGHLDVLPDSSPTCPPADCHLNVTQMHLSLSTATAAHRPPSAHRWT